MARIKIEVLSDTRDTERKLKNIQKMLEDLQKRGVSITADSNLDATIKKLAQAYEQVGQSSKKGTKITIDALHEMERAAKETGGAVSKIFDKQAGSSGRNWALEKIRELQIVGDKVIAMDTLVKRTLNKNGNVEYRIISQTFTEDIGKAEVAIGKLDTKVESVRSSILTFYNTVKNSSYKYEEGLFDPILQNLEQLLALTDEMRAKKADGGLEIADESKLKAISDALQTVRGDYKELTKDNERLTTATDTLVGKLGQMALQYISLTAIISKLTSAFRSAMNEMKNVDSVLTSIQKVTDWSTTQMEELSNAAYEVASAYGVTASAYLESVAAFAQAGYRDMADQLGELAVKTQLVGDVTSQTANEFLLAVDSAFKFNGNVEDLSRVLDEANFIENNYATSIEKLADSMPIVANVASMVGMSVEETLAALGTITASTQETGQKAATAFRSIILNITGETTQLEEAERLTAAEMKNLSDFLSVYARDAVEAANATGKLVNPMQAIAALAEQWQSGNLTEQTLTSLAYSLGGKLRVNDLMALISNFDKYEEMLEGIAGAAGSAQKEVDTMLTSWESKANILSNTWTQFVQNTLNSDTVKFFLDVATAILKVTDNLGTLVQVALGLSVALHAKEVLEFFEKLNAKHIQPLIENVKNLRDAFRGVATSAETAAQQVGLLIAAIALINLGYQKLKKYVEEKNEADRKGGEEAYKSTKDIVAMYSEMEHATGKVTDQTYEFAEAIGVSKKKVDELKGSYSDLREEIASATKEKLRLLKLDAEEAVKASQSGFTGLGSSVGAVKDAALGVFHTEDDEKRWRAAMGGSGLPPATMARQALAFGKQEMNNIEAEGGEVSKELAQAVANLESEIDAYDEAVERAVFITGAYNALLDGTLDEFLAMQDETPTGELDSYGESMQNLNKEQERAKAAMESLNEQIDAQQSALDVLTSAQEEYNDSGYLSLDTVQQLLDLDADYLNALVDENGQINLNSESINGLITAKGGLIQQLAAEAIATYTATRTQELLEEQMRSSASAASATQSAIYNAGLNALQSGQNAAAGATGWATFYNAVRGLGADSGLNVANQQRLVADVRAYANSVQSVINSIGSGVGRASGGGGGRSGGGSSSSSRDAKLEKLKDIVSLRESELTLLEKQDAPIAQQVAKIQEINNAIQDQIDYLKRTGGSQEDINKLLAKQLDYQRDIKKLEEDLWNSLRDAIERQIEDVEKLRDAELDAIDEQIEALQEAHDIEDDRLTLEEKILAVQEAQAALINAQNERTVRYFNAATGQWEWGANAQNVLSAQQALERAQEELTNYQNDLAYQAAIDELEAQKEAINAAYDVTIASWQAIIDSLEAPVATLQEVLDQIGQNATPNMLAQIEIINGLLEQFGYAIDTTTNQIAQATASSSSGSGNTTNHTGSTNTTTTPRPSTTPAPSNTPTTTSHPTIHNSTSYGGNGSGTTYTHHINQTAMFDSGGVLTGLGGIKATAQDEIVIPPDIASKMLSPKAGQAFRARMDELRYLYGRSTGFGGRIDNSIGTQNNGDIYQFGGVTLTTQQARSMTVYDLAQRSRVLSIHNSVH